MNEHSYIRSVHRSVPSDIYTWKINDNYQNGVADAYYSGVAGDHWIEYKYENLPKKGTSKVKIDLSEGQRLWLRGRYREGRKVAVVIGSSIGAVIMTDPEDWDRDYLLKQEFEARAVDKNSVVAFIISRCATV